MKFYLGTHRPHWLADTTVPLFVSNRLLAGRKTLPRASCLWALDSGGFSELGMYGEWRTTPHSYAAHVRRYIDNIGSLGWASPQDWMCEPWITAKTGLSVTEHQRRTVDNYRDLRTLGPDMPFIPVLQGWEPDDYLRHVDMYDAAGVDLEAEDTVGLGSVCRRQATGEAWSIVNSLRPLRLHGFGMKTQAVAELGAMLTSSDSMAWSFAGRRRPDPSCPKRACNNCRHYALAWRDRLLSPVRPSLWGAV
jgi:hypothetical protein